MFSRIVLSFILGVFLTLSPSAFAAGSIEKIEIEGVEESEIVDNIKVSLSMSDAIGKVQGEARLEYLLNQAKTQAREALEPFGYYSPTIRIESVRTPGAGKASEALVRQEESAESEQAPEVVDRPRNREEWLSRADKITVIIHVDVGEQVRVRQSQVSISGVGGEDQYLAKEVIGFQPKQGDMFSHGLYEDSKTRITRRLSDRGYFDAELTSHRVSVTRADLAADIDLSWDSGRRYNMGPVGFIQSHFRPGLLEKLVYWEQGSYYHQGKLDRLDESLMKLDYFSVIDIQPFPEGAGEDGEVPISVDLTLAKRDIYTAGLSYGTESGPGVRLGLDRRYVNNRGHKMSTQLDYASKRKSFITTYRVPAFHWLDGWYAFSMSGYDEQTKYMDLRNYKFSASRSGEINDYWTAIVSANFLRERWSYDVDEKTGEGRSGYQYASLLYPQLSLTYKNANPPMFPTQGFSGNADIRGGANNVGSDTSFLQLRMAGYWYMGLGENSRLILRGEGGTTLTNGLDSMPPSLRFFAGGDRSIRGYGYREVGPRTGYPNRYAVGAKHVVTGSAEFEHYFGAGPLGAAIFVDSGSAFDITPDWRTGVGLGVRWRSPVGPVRVDIAHGLNDPDSQFQIYLNIGADL